MFARTIKAIDGCAPEPAQCRDDVVSPPVLIQQKENKTAHPAPADRNQQLIAARKLNIT